MGAPPSRTNPDGQPWGYPVLDPRQYFRPDGQSSPPDDGPALALFRARLDQDAGRVRRRAHRSPARPVLPLGVPGGPAGPVAGGTDRGATVRFARAARSSRRWPGSPSPARSSWRPSPDHPRYADDWVRGAGARPGGPLRHPVRRAAGDGPPAGARRPGHRQRGAEHLSVSAAGGAGPPPSGALPGDPEGGPRRPGGRLPDRRGVAGRLGHAGDPRHPAHLAGDRGVAAAARDRLGPLPGPAAGARCRRPARVRPAPGERSPAAGQGAVRRSVRRARPGGCRCSSPTCSG